MLLVEASWYITENINTEFTSKHSALGFACCQVSQLFYRAGVLTSNDCPCFLSEKKQTQVFCSNLLLPSCPGPESGLRFLSICHSRKASGKLLPEHTLLVHPASDSSKEWWMDRSARGRWPELQLFTGPGVTGQTSPPLTCGYKEV